VTRYRRIERFPDDLVKPWPVSGQSFAAGVFLVVAALVVIWWAM